MEREVFVYLDLSGHPIPVGRLWARVRGRRESASFEYDTSWLQRSDRFSLQPALKLGQGVFHTTNDKHIFGAIGDSAPDRWGRALMRRAERRRANEEKEKPRTLFEIDYLLKVNDFARQGALRFSLEPDGPFLATDEEAKIPPFVSLPKLLTAATNITGERESEEDLKLLLAPGSSLGGARPKASILDKDGKLLIAKFPCEDDDIDVVKWEAVSLTLASQAGLNVPQWRIVQVGSRTVLLLQKFDRTANVNQQRIPFLSAMSMLDASDHESHSYLEIADAIKMYGNSPEKDLKELFCRMVFNIMISNTDDHLRNHGFLYQDLNGWRLSPVYDLNPVPVDIKPRILTTNITEDDGTASLELALEVFPQFRLDESTAIRAIKRIGQAVSTWKAVAEQLGVAKSGIKRMTSAFECGELIV